MRSVRYVLLHAGPHLRAQVQLRLCVIRAQVSNVQLQVCGVLLQHVAAAATQRARTALARRLFYDAAAKVFPAIKRVNITNWCGRGEPC